MAIRLKELAEKAGLAKSTVSNILNKESTCFASEETKKRVYDLARKYGYRPNPLAASLTTKKTNTIGLAMQSMTYEVAVDLVVAIEAQLWEEKYDVYIAYGHRTPETNMQLIDNFAARNVDGIISNLSTADDKFRKKLEKLAKSGIPVITISPTAKTSCSVVDVDRTSGAYKLVKHLISQGHKRIAFFINDLNGAHNITRFTGYKRAVEEAGLKIDKKLILEDSGTGSFEWGVKKAERFIEQKLDATAVFCYNDLVAIGAMQTFRKNGLKVPDDISVAGFNNIKMCDMIDVPLTTVDIGMDKLGKIAAQLVLKQIRTKDTTTVERIIKPTLLIRESTDPPAK
jgi:LacI family transcriptional regulator, galactose operon repressor